MDHKPLLGILTGDRQTPPVLLSRLIRWTVFFAAYNYTLSHQPGKNLCHADALSHYPLPIVVEDPVPASAILLINALQLPVTATDVAKYTAWDKVLTRVLDLVRRGWPQGTIESEYHPYKIRQHELSMQQGCLLWDTRVVIPAQLQRSVLSTLH